MNTNSLPQPVRVHYAWLASIIDSEGIGIKTNRQRHLEAVRRILAPYANILRTLKQSNYDLIEIVVEPRQPCVSLTRGSQWMDSTATAAFMGSFGSVAALVSAPSRRRYGLPMCLYFQSS